MHNTMIGYMFYLLLNFVIITQSILQLSSPLLKPHTLVVIKKRRSNKDRKKENEVESCSTKNTAASKEPVKGSTAGAKPVTTIGGL